MRERVSYRGQIFTRDPESKNKSKRLYFRRKVRIWYEKRYVYQFLHRIIWSDHNGPIPAGSIIRHIDGNSSNNEISNLECVNKEEHLRTCRTRAAKKSD
jgi:hypothetical protein